ncbi:MAG: RNA methyltransferase [Myxococcota bacterium]|jgi:TrmH RNA methyltransferase|nr:RNA methyltransferase [Myxococcota bacterium]
MQRESQNICGVNACLAVFERRAQDIERVYYHIARASDIGHVLKWAASQRLPYREVDLASLEKLSHSTHHEGLVFTVKALEYRTCGPDTVAPGQSWVALDGVENPHNIGAIARTCAFFGCAGLLLGGVQPGTRLPASLLRAAEGGAELLPLYGCPELAPLLTRLRSRGLPVFGLETDVDAVFSPSTAAADGVLVFGSESLGISPRVREACSGLLKLQGAGALQSLNVSVSVAMALTLSHCGVDPLRKQTPSREPVGQGTGSKRRLRRR